MADLDYPVSYEEVRRINHLNSEQVPDDELDQHLDQAETEVESLAHSSFLKDNTPVFTDELFNTRDLMAGRIGKILYLSKHDFGELQTITAVSYRSDEDSGWEDLDAGQNYDYVVDTDVDALKFTTGLSSDGNQNLKASGTYGFKHSDLPKKWKYLIALIAALQGVVYASGGSFENVDSHNVGNITVNKGQYSPNLKTNYNNILKKIESHMKAHGIKAERTQIDII